MAEHQCLNCGAAGARAYCPECGQRHIPADLLDLRHLVFDYVEEVFRELKPVNTVVGLVRRPGQQSVDYVEGRRKRQANPLLLYLFVVGLAVTLAENQDHAGQAEAMLGPLMALVGAVQPAGSDVDVIALISSWRDHLEGLFRVGAMAAVYLAPPVVLCLEVLVLRLAVGGDLLRAGVTMVHVAVFSSLVSIPAMILVLVSTSGQAQITAMLAVYALTELAWLLYGVAAVRRVYEERWLRSAGTVIAAGIVSRTLIVVLHLVISTVLGLLLGVGMGLYLSWVVQGA